MSFGVNIATTVVQVVFMADSGRNLHSFKCNSGQIIAKDDLFSMNAA